MEFLFDSLVFHGPRFTYLEAQEFYIAADASCEQPLKVPRRRVPVGNKTLLELQIIEATTKQRLHLETFRSSALGKQDAHFDARAWFDSHVRPQILVLPAVELYMFPDDVQNVSSTWKVLLLPRSRAVFGRTVYLCRKPEVLLNPCIAKLPFSGLPFRFIHLLGIWDPDLGSSRSTPHRLLLLLEVFVLALGLCATCLVLVSAKLMMQAAWKQYTPPADGLRKDALLGDRLPKVYILIQHAFVYKDARKGELHRAEPLDACREVTVLEMVEADRERRGLIEQLQHFLLHRGESALWGRLEDPSGWIVLANGAEDVRVVTEGELPSSLFCANPELLQPLPSMLRRQWVLAASHATVQLYLLESLSKMFEMSVISVISASLLAIHLLVLCQMEMTYSAALHYEQAMERQGKLVTLTGTSSVLTLLVSAVVMLLVAVAVGILGNEAMVSAAIPCTSLATSVAWHLMDFRSSLAGLDKWRSPQLKATEFTGTAGKSFETISSSDSKSLTRGREFQKQMMRFLVGLLAVGALGILVLLCLDGMKMRGELVDYSFSCGRLSIPPNPSAVQNTLLLHTSVDSCSFRFEAGLHTSKVHLRLEHAYGYTALSQGVTVFDEDHDKVNTGEEKRAGEISVNLPAGPLYSRIIVSASSHLHKTPTRYMIHLLRVGEAVKLLLDAPVNPAHFSKEESTLPRLLNFHETRRWLYQQNNPAWYVPDLDVRSNSSLRIEHLPIIFAPVLNHKVGEAAVAERSGVTTVASTCLCGTERAGFGNSCAVQLPVTLRSGSSMCLFQHGLQRELRVDDGPGSISVHGPHGSDLAEWLAHAEVSGRPAVLQLSAPSTGQVSYWHFSKVKEPKLGGSADAVHHGRLTTILETSIPTEMLLTQVALLATEDMTYAEGLAVPLKLTSHAPPIHLSINSTEGLLLPERSGAHERADFAACGLRDPAQVTGTLVAQWCPLPFFGSRFPYYCDQPQKGFLVLICLLG